MEAKEFRAGNLLNYTTAEGDVLETSLDWQDFKWLKEDRKGFEAVHDYIPLTEDRLIDFGFEKTDKKDALVISVGEYDLYVVQNAFSGTLDKEPSWFCSVSTGYGSQPMSLVKMYVHEIQNLYFALTGKELTKKEQ